MSGSAQITISGLSDSLFNGLTHGSTNQTQAMLSLSKLLRNIALGAGSHNATSVTLNVSTADAARASGTVTIASGNGATAATISGTAVSVTWATSDANTASLLATAINANTTVNKYVSAVASAGTVIITAHQPGKIGNRITLTASGTNVTVTGSGFLTGTTTGAGGDAAPIVYSL